MGRNITPAAPAVAAGGMRCVIGEGLDDTQLVVARVVDGDRDLSLANHCGADPATVAASRKTSAAGKPKPESWSALLKQRARAEDSDARGVSEEGVVRVEGEVESALMCVCV